MRPSLSPLSTAPALAGVLLAALLLGPPGRPAGAAEPRRPVGARAVWAMGDRVYVAMTDSALAPGTFLTFLERGRTIASGEVSRVYDTELALARLTSGSLDRVRRLDRVRVLAEPARVETRPDATRPVPTNLDPTRAVLRVGFPSGRRSNLLFSCGDARLVAPTRLPYHVEPLAPDRYRLIRTDAAMGAGWPDSLLVLLFADAADEEIALERGELDAAVFWPGEPSARLRSDPRWPIAGGTRSRGVLAALWDDADSTAAAAAALDSLDFSSLNRQLFRGDLTAWNPPAARESVVSSTIPSRRRWETARYEVAPSSPGRIVLERFLNRGKGALPRGVVQPTVRLFYLDAPVGRLDSLALALAEEVARSAATVPLRARATRVAARLRDPSAGEALTPERLAAVLRELQTRPIFTIPSPVVASPEIQSQLEALRSGLVDLLECRPVP